MRAGDAPLSPGAAWGRRLEPLFPAWAGPGPAQGRRRVAVAAAYALSALGVAAVLLGRQPGVPAAATMWAEDGRVFYSQAVSLPFGRALLTPDNGYYQLVPRLLAELASLVRPPDAAAVMAGTGALCVAGCTVLVFRTTRAHIPAVGARLLLAAGMVLLPTANAELVANAVNVPWWGMFAAFWLLLWRPAGWAGRAVAFSVCALVAASQPLVGLLLPLAAARAVVLRRPSEHWAGAGLLSGLTLQLVGRLADHHRRFLGGLHPWAGTEAFFERAGLVLVAGQRGSDQLVHWHPVVAAGLGALVWSGVLGGALAFGDRRTRTFTVAAAASSVVSFYVPVWLRGLDSFLSVSPVEDGSRYALSASLLTLSTLAVALGRRRAAPAWPSHHRALHRGPGRAGRRLLAHRPALALALCTLALAPAWAVDLRDANMRSAGPAWGAQVATAAATCRAGGRRWAVLRTDPAGWSARLPCSALVPGAPTTLVGPGRARGRASGQAGPAVP